MLFLFQNVIFCVFDYIVLFIEFVGFRQQITQTYLKRHSAV